MLEGVYDSLTPWLEPPWSEDAPEKGGGYRGVIGVLENVSDGVLVGVLEGVLKGVLEGVLEGVLDGIMS